MSRKALAMLLAATACSDPGREVVIESDGGDVRIAYECGAEPRKPSVSDRAVIQQYVLRMTKAGAVPADSLPILMAAYETRDWDYMQAKAVEHACSEGALPAIPPTFPAPGTEAPALSLPRLDGSGPVALNDYKGQFVLVDFWATWCAPCIAELPKYEEWAERAPDDLKVLAVVHNEPPSTAQAWLTTNGLVRVIGLMDPEGRTAGDYGVSGAIPVTYLLDRDGRVVPACDSCTYRANRPDFEEVLERALGW